MNSLLVKFGTIEDGLGRKRSGWIVFEDGQPSIPHETKEKAIRSAEGLKSIRCAPHVQVKVQEAL
jgi:hypothetical protein